MSKSLEQLGMSQNLSQEKEEKLRHFYAMLEKLVGMDHGIQDTVAYLNALGFRTTESCEGHIDHGSLAPRVGMEAPGKPKWRFVGEEEIFKNVAEKHGVTLDEMFAYAAPKYNIPEDERVYPANEEEIIATWNEGWDLAPKEEETDEFKLWRKKTDTLAENLDVLVQEFYQKRNVGENEKLRVDRNDFNRHVYNYYLHNGGKDYLVMADPDEREKLSDEEKDVLRKRLEINQKEMKDFTEFLKEKYYNEKSNF